jgi:hypothetical protein
MTFIKTDIFDDGKEPVTCARSFERKEFCPQLLSSHFGMKFSCRLFTTFDRNDDLSRGPEGFLIPCKQCLEQRTREE